MQDLLSEYWYLLVAAVAYIGWLGRLEARTVANTASIKRMEAQRIMDIRVAKEARDQDREDSREARDEVHKMLAEMRSDIKLLLNRGGSV